MAIRLGIIGFGGMGAHHASQIKHNPRLQLVGVYDIDSAACQNVSRQNLRVFADAQELLDAVDAVLIATPNDVHKHYTILAAKAGKHIICEKPAALDSTEVDAMYDAAQKAGVVLYIHQNRRWDNDFLTMHGIIKSGTVGEVYRIESRVMGSHGIPGGWRKQASKGGGMMLDWGVHLIDQILQAFSAKIIGVFCRTSYLFGHEVDDGFELMLDFEDGLDVKIVVDTNSFVPLPRWMIYGIDGTAIINDWDCTGKIVEVSVRRDPHLKAIKAGNGFTKTMSVRSEESVIEAELNVIKSSGKEFYEAFCNSVESGAEPVVGRNEVMRVMRVMEMALKSADERQYIKVNL